MTGTIIPPGDDGFYRPGTEGEIIDLVKVAYNERLQIRCRGSAHSVAHAIYTDAGPSSTPVPNRVSQQTPPLGRYLNLLLDNYDGLTWIDEAQGIVEVEAGIHLGADPNAPDHDESLHKSLLWQAFQKGWTLRDLGGITHQTVSGFLATGSSGGSLQFSVEENIVAFRVIDGRGDVQWFDRDQHEDMFDALGVSFGLLGIISKLRLRLTPMFSVYGQEVTTPTDLADCPVDLFGPGRDGKPSLKRFLERTPYSRVLWWPQAGVERAVFWQAVPGPPLAAFVPQPYREFAGSTFERRVQQLAASILFTLVGNLDDLSQVPDKLDDDFAEFDEAVKLLLKSLGLGETASAFLAKLLSGALEDLADAAIVLLQSEIRKRLPRAFPKLIDLFQPMTHGTPKVFMDHAWRSLPMDNAVDDILLSTEFTEIWVPLEETERVMSLLVEHFAQGGPEATGYFSTELYAATESRFWLSPSYGGPAFRIDPFWFTKNAGEPAERDGFFDQFWRLLRDKGIPFRLHWGKFLPAYDHHGWAEYFRHLYPRWDDFLVLRAQRDPHDVFLTDYWRTHLGVEHRPR